MNDKIEKIEGYISLTEFKQFMTEPIIPIEDITDSENKSIVKIFQFWRRKELLPFFAPGKWNLRVSFMQMIWIDILLTLREFSFSIENTKKVCDYFYKDAYYDELPKLNLEANKKALEKKVLAGTISLEEKFTLENIDMMLADETVLYVLKFTINYLTQLVYDCIITSEETGILIFSDGSIVERVGSHYKSHKLEDLAIAAKIEKPHIYLSIKHFLKRFIDNDELQAIILPQILNEEEMVVLSAIRNKNIKELNIKLKDGEIVRIDSSMEGFIPDEKANEVKNILGLRNYEDISISTYDGKKLRFKKTIKRIKSD